MSFHEKYLKYKNKYSQLKVQKNIFNMIGGKLCSATNTNIIDSNDITSLFKYLHDEYQCTKDKTTNKKYFIVLYGPPASGKTDAISEGCKLTQSIFNETQSIDDIMSSLIDTNIDNLVYKFEDTKQKLIDQVSTKLIESQSKTEEEINDISKLSFSIYKKARDIVDPISSLLIWLAVYLKKNILFETSAGSFDYVINMCNLLKYYDYIPIIIFPYISDLDILYNRSLARGMKEGRVINKDKIRYKMTTSITDFNNINVNFLSTFQFFDDIILCSYDNTTRQKESPITYNNLIYKKDKILHTEIYNKL
jgi:hypothetical protein